MADLESREYVLGRTYSSSCAFGTEIDGQYGVPYNQRKFPGIFLAGSDEGDLGDSADAGPYRAFIYMPASELRSRFGDLIVDSAVFQVTGCSFVMRDQPPGEGYLGIRIESIDGPFNDSWSNITGQNYPPHGSWKSAVTQVPFGALGGEWDVTTLIKQVISGQRNILGLAVVYVPEQSYFPSSSRTAYWRNTEVTQFKLTVSGRPAFVETREEYFDVRVRLDGPQDLRFDVLAEFPITEAQPFDARVSLGAAKSRLFDVALKLGAKHSSLFDTKAEIGSIRQWSYDVALLLVGRQKTTFDTSIRLYAVDPLIREKYGRLPQSVRYMRRYRGPVESERENSLVLSGLSDLRRALGLLEDLDDRLTAAQDQILFGGGHPGLYDLRLP